jgi:mannose-6-phosphate isomerase-like protein (cupin superfamily)
MFMVVKGRFRMKFRAGAGPDASREDRHVWLEEGEFIVVPRGVEHRPVADEECWILLFEPASTLNTGNVGLWKNWSSVGQPQRKGRSVWGLAGLTPVEQALQACI